MIGMARAESIELVCTMSSTPAESNPTPAAGIPPPESIIVIMLPSALTDFNSPRTTMSCPTSRPFLTLKSLLGIVHFPRA